MDTVTVLRPCGLADRRLSCKKSKSTSRLPQVCIVCSLGWRNFGYELYMVDFNEDVSTTEFDLKIPQIQVDDFGELHFCVSRSILCMFESGRIPSKSVYTFELPKNVFELSNYTLDRDTVQCASLKFSKTRPSTINYGKWIVIFSTRIFFADSRDDDMHDFELFDAAGRRSQILPNLLIRPNRCYVEPFKPRSYYLCDTEDRVSATFVGDNSVGISSTFTVQGYGIVNPHTLVVQTEMGMVFQLNLQNPDEGWKEWNEGWLRHPASEFFVTDDGICLSRSGAYDIRIRDLTSQLNLWLSVIAVYFCVTDKDKEYVKKIKHKIRHGDYDVMKRLDEVSRCLPYSMTRFERLEELDNFRFMSTVASDCACVVQMGMYNTLPHFIVDVVQLNVSKFPKHDYHKFRERIEELEFCVRNQKWTKLVKSVTFISPQSCDRVCVAHVLPLMIGRQKNKTGQQK